jgi:hypothetical protein
MQNVTSIKSVTVNSPDQPRAKLTRALLTCGIIVGPLYTTVGLIQAFTRPGFDITRHVMSILSNGSLEGASRDVQRSDTNRP